jgi:hypothetical protein
MKTSQPVPVVALLWGLFMILWVLISWFELRICWLWPVRSLILKTRNPKKMKENRGRVRTKNMRSPGARRINLKMPWRSWLSQIPANVVDLGGNGHDLGILDGVLRSAFLWICNDVWQYTAFV